VDANSEVAELQAQRVAAGQHVDELERAWRSANEEVSSASSRLTEAERAGASPSTLRKIEGELAAARQRSEEPWPERVQGSRRAVRDVDARIRAHAAAHLPDLVEELEARGQAVADRINEWAANLVADHAELERLAAELGRLLTAITPPGPMDVSRSECEPVVRTANSFIANGGGRGPKVSRVNAPWDRLLGVSEPRPETETETVAA
jgi:hypothetical protein